MPRLVSFEPAQGRRMRIDGHSYTISFAEQCAPKLTLRSDRDESTVTISRSELAGLLVQERAEFVDELEDPESTKSRVITGISTLALHRKIDWFCKMLLIRRMMPYRSNSPKGAVFKHAYVKACAELSKALHMMGIWEFKPWSMWTIYHDLLRMRNHHFELAAIQEKGVEYCPHSTAAAFKQEIAELVNKVVLKSPHLSAKSVHKQVNKRLKAKASLPANELGAAQDG